MKETVYKNLEQFINDTVYHTGYWFPLEELTTDIPVIAYNIKKLFAEQRPLLEAVMRECGIGIVTEVNMEAGSEGVFEGQNIYKLLTEQLEYDEFDLRFWRPCRRKSYYTFPTSVETYYFDESKTWLIYVSHEGTLTFAGTALVAAAQKMIPNRYLFCGWDSKTEKK